MNDVTVQDLIASAYEQKPIEFQQAFDSLIASKIAVAVDGKKLEMAQSLFSDQPQSEDYEDTDSDQEEPQDGEVS